MKVINYIFIPIFMFYAFESKEQCLIQIDTISFSYFNGFTKKYQTVDNYKILNNSNEEYLTWVSSVSTNDKSNIRLIHDFFFKRNGDFNLFHLMYDLFSKRPPISIGFSFIKNILLGETFSYFIVKTDSTSMLYHDKIVIMKKSEVEQYLKMPIQKDFFYPLTSIILTDN